jgi:hypothetical protein
MQDRKDLPEKSKGIFVEYRWIVLAVVLLAVIGYVIWQEFLRSYERLRLAYQSTGRSAVIDDSDSLSGNRDGQLNPGERVKVRLYATNAGEKPLSKVELKLSTKTPEVKLIDKTVNFARIDTGQTVLSTDPFEFELRATANLDQLSFEGEIEDAETTDGDPAKPEDDNPTVPISIYVYPNFQICAGACTVQQGADSTAPDILAINLSLCNNAASTLSNVRIEVDASTIKACRAPQDSFKVVNEQGIQMDSHIYGDIPANNCKGPFIPTRLFKFSAPALMPAGSDSTMCFSFGVRIWQGILPPVLRTVGIKAKLLRRPSQTPVFAGNKATLQANVR